MDQITKQMEEVHEQLTQPAPVAKPVPEQVEPVEVQPTEITADER